MIGFMGLRGDASAATLITCRQCSQAPLVMETGTSKGTSFAVFCRSTKDQQNRPQPQPQSHSTPSPCQNTAVIWAVPNDSLPSRELLGSSFATETLALNSTVSAKKLSRACEPTNICAEQPAIQSGLAVMSLIRGQSWDKLCKPQMYLCTFRARFQIIGWTTIPNAELPNTHNIRQQCTGLSKT
jgi:hypothetical protein